MDTTAQHDRKALAVSNSNPQPRGFTLVELLVVITIIGILASLITVAASGALKRAHQAQIKTELNQLDMAFQTYSQAAGYPPNCVNLVNTAAAISPSMWNVSIQSQVLTDLKRHFKQAFPRSKEPDALLQLLVGQTVSGMHELSNGMSAGEAVVFWLGGFSSDPKYPISGEGGPSYPITTISNSSNNTLDPLTRKWVFPFATTRLLPRDKDNYFDNKDNRYIEYTVNINGVNQNRRINFWQYVPAKSEQPYLYFDVSRHAPYELDPPASSTAPIYAIKQLGSNVSNPSSPILSDVHYANEGKCQILHPGIDDDWGSYTTLGQTLDVDFTAASNSNVNSNLKLYPTGPFTGELADTIVNFSEATLSASQK